LFTIDEETGMTGALNLKGGILQGEILLNLDTEEDTKSTLVVLVELTSLLPLSMMKRTPEGSVGYTITVRD
jgi:dipeptidase D